VLPTLVALSLSFLKENMNTKTFAQIVGRNEQGRYLEEVLQRLSHQVDNIIFTDDCSDDNTLSIAKKYSITYQTPEPLFSKHEGQLRSFAWGNLCNHAKVGDWIVAIDCDEMLYRKDDLDNLNIKEILSKSEFDVVNVKFYHMWNKNQYRQDKLWAPTNSSRIFRFRENGGFINKRLACGSEPSYVIDWIRQKNYWPGSGLIMKHMGYEKDEDKTAKYERYCTLDKGEFHNIKHIESIMDENPTLISWGNFGV
jgi:glycosyltransferase involved in cell wall biosynthesis